VSHLLERLAARVTALVGGSWAFACAFLVVLIWLATGPLFRYSDTWQLVINTGTTIVTFLMVFLIQRSQNKESRALQLKLDELVKAQEGASNQLIDAENLSEDELRALAERYHGLAREAAARPRVD
jgi:low affinity Fe/Cu permease